MLTPKSSENENSPPGENDDLLPQFNPATNSASSHMDYDEWIYLNSIVEIFPQYNPATSQIAGEFYDHEE